MWAYAAVELFTKEREKNGQFTDLATFLDRIALTKVNRRVVESLIKVGAFDSIHANRRALLKPGAPPRRRPEKGKGQTGRQETLFSLEEFSEDNADQAIALPGHPGLL